MAAADSLWHTPYPNVMGAGPMLMYDNVQLIPLNYGDTKRHPRTVIGIRPDGTIILMVVDGRQEGADGHEFGTESGRRRIFGTLVTQASDHQPAFG